MNTPTIQDIKRNGDCAVLIEINGSNDELQRLGQLARTHPLGKQINAVASQKVLGLAFSAPMVDMQSVQAAVQAWLKQLNDCPNQITTHRIPVCYHPSLAPDLTVILKRLDMGLDDLIQRHTSAKYDIAMLGFLPGFAYLNGLPESLQLPRKSTPSIQVPAGSVAMAGDQCGLYALNSPGGWWVIGRTPAVLFNPAHESLVPYRALDRMRFEAISLDDYHQRVRGL